MDATAKVRRRIALKRLNEAYLCAKRCLTDPNYKDRFATHCERLPDLLCTFDDAHTKILLCIDSDDFEDGFQQEDETRTTFDETYSDIMEIKLKIFGNASKIYPGRSDNPHESLMLDKPQAQVKLPRIELKTFNGDYKNWLPFRDLFDTLIHRNESLSNVEKFSYLLSSLEGPALNFIKVFPLSDVNYAEAYRTLFDRYENKRNLAFMSWEAIINAKLAANNSASLRHLLDIFSENLAILKNLDLPIDNWDFVLFHTLISKLHASMRKDFEMSVTSHDIPSFLTLKTFVFKYCQAWERSSSQADSTPLPVSSVVKGKNPAAVHRPGFNKPDKLVPHTTLVVSANDNSCSMCAKNHFIGHCPDFQSLSPHKKFETVKAGRWCVNCLRASHTTKFCKTKSTCRLCGRRHHTLLHLPSKTSNDVPVPNSSTAPSSPTSVSSNENTAVIALTNTVNSGKICMLSTAIVEVLDGKGKYQEVRVLLDGGSHVNFMTDSCVKRLGLEKSQTAGPSYGLDLNEIADLGMVHCAMRPCGQPGRSLSYEASIVRKICHDLPSRKVNIGNVTHFKNITFADPTLDTPGPIDILLGGDVLQHVLLPGIIPATETSPLARDTIFGWVLLGTVACEGAKRATALLVTSDHSLHAAVERLWEIENIPSDLQSSPEDQLCEDIFNKTHCRGDHGRYMVELPFKSDVPTFHNMRSIALKRFYACENRLIRNPPLHEAYCAFMQNYLDSNHMSPVPVNDSYRSDAYYIPHHCVINEHSPSTRLRVVFDASAKDSHGHSLNNYQLTGHKLQTDIPAILLRFRMHNVVFTADIKQMYRQILIKKTHRHLQRILWRFSSSEPVKEYELNTVTYGVSSSPFLALRVIQQLAIDEGAAFPQAAEVVKRDIYIDDIPCGADSVEGCLTLQQQLIDMMATGGFELRKWASNDPRLLKRLPLDHCLSKSQTCDLDQDHFIKVLGLRWDPVSDQYLYDVRPLNRDCSKRTILSELARIFDPLGFVAPLTFLAKCLVQKLWLQGVDWDEQPSQEVVDLWKLYIDQLPLLRNLRIPRQITNPLALSYQLHGFGDASEAGYGAAIYIRCSLPDGTFRAQLVSAKSRVAPVKRLTLPRLELCAAVLVAELMRYVINSLANLLSPHHIFMWSDSMITLAWINSSPIRWKTFIANRVSRIQQKIPEAVWNYVDTNSNPADCVSRGLLPNKLIEHPLWFTGPEWLVNSQEHWPSVRSIPSQALLLSEQEQNKSALTTTTREDGIMHLLLRFSSLKKIQRVVVYVHRFIKATRKTHVLSGAITAFEMDEALMLMVSHVQKLHFATEIDCIQKGKTLTKPMRKLNAFISVDSILRVGGRLQNAPLTYDAKHPAILPNNHRLTSLIIEDVHETHMHPGPQAVQFLLAQNFWVLSARRAIKRCLSRCIRCFRVKPTSVQPVMAQLPPTRVSGIKAFAIVGCDYAGPFNVTLGTRRRGSRSQKVYLCLFVCFATKALHLEVASDLSSDAFIAALRRFIARRGRCTQIISDCGTNFIGAYRQLAPLMEEAAKHEYIAFSTHPPSGPHFSGLAEAGVKSVKAHLHRVVGSQLLTYEELQTLVVQIEAVLNSRPLCALSNDPNDLSVLTPGHFLTLEPLTALPDVPLSQLQLLNRWHLLQRLHGDFWRRWHHDYLNTLMQRHKWTKGRGTLAVGDLVLIKDDDLKPLYWRLGRVIDVHPGADGVVRVATVRTNSGSFKRPAVKLCPLPVELD